MCPHSADPDASCAAGLRFHVRAPSTWAHAPLRVSRRVGANVTNPGRKVKEAPQREQLGPAPGVHLCPGGPAREARFCRTTPNPVIPEAHSNNTVDGAVAPNWQWDSTP